MAQLDQRRAAAHARARGFENIDQIVEQPGIRAEAAAHATRFAMTVLVVTANGEAPTIETLRQRAQTEPLLASAYIEAFLDPENAGVKYAIG